MAFPKASYADSLKSKDFLKWEQDSQDWYLDISVNMAASIASQNTDGQARCIYEWYYEDGGVNPEKKKHIYETMKSYSEYTPQAVILAVLQKACGTFNYGNSR